MDRKEIDNIREKLNKCRITEWLHPSGLCGETCYECTTNRGWIKCELERLKHHRVKARVITYEGLMAIFRLEDGETESSIKEKLVKVGGVNSSDMD